MEHRFTKRVLLGASAVAFALITVTACSSSGGGVPSGTGPGAKPAGAVAGQSDDAAVCRKLPVSDAQALVRPKLPAAVTDPRLGGCTFVLPGNKVNDNNLTVAFEVGGQAASRYQQDVSGTFVAGGSTMHTGARVSTSLAGVGDKAMWGSTAGFPMVSALKGDVYCSVSTADAANELTIIGRPGAPLPEGTPAQQARYAQLESKLCTDLFGLVH